MALSAQTRDHAPGGQPLFTTEDRRALAKSTTSLSRLTLVRLTLLADEQAARAAIVPLS
jgi:hypothetical protein